jgi:hypothetical protein
MFARMCVPCVAVAENMAYFDADDKRYFPFGKVRCWTEPFAKLLVRCTGSVLAPAYTKTCW